MQVLAVQNVIKWFPVESGIFKKRTGYVRAVNNVSLSLEAGGIIGLVGESGSGKTTLGRIICNLTKPDSGRVIIDGKTADSYSRRELALKVQMVFQDPFASLNPKLTIGTALNEAAWSVQKNRRAHKVSETLKLVGLEEDALTSYPHQFSGGQRQRIALARALVCGPKIIVADEPLSSLDISIQNQLLNLFAQLKRSLSVSFIFVSHDLVTASNIADYMIVMQNGAIAEEGSVKDVVLSPKSEYTKKLLLSVPKIGQAV